MNRKLRALGLALFVAVAMGAFSASAASAAKFHSEVTETIIKGTQLGEHVFTFNAGNVKCKKALFSGVQTEEKVESLNVEFSYNECTAFGFLAAVVDPNECEFTLHANINIADIVCPPGKAIAITSVSCWVTIPPQAALKNVAYVNENTGKDRDIRVNANITGIEYTQHSKMFPGCSTNGGKPRTDGTSSFSTTLTGSTKEGEKVGTWRE